MAEIKLTNSDVLAIVDDEDFKWLSEYKWRLSANGYVIADLKRVRLRMHRLILAALPGIQVDHINRVRHDNRRANLRVATAHLNSRNRAANCVRQNGAKFKGIFRCSENRSRWRASIKIGDRKRHNLGTYATQEEAARAYDEAARKHFGAFAYLNFPKGVTEVSRQKRSDDDKAE